MNFYRLPKSEQRARSFRSMISYLKEYIEPYHPFHRKNWKELGIDVGRIESYEEFAEKVPVISKAEYRQDGRAFILQPKFPGRESQVPYDTEKIRTKHLLGLMKRALFNSNPRDYVGLYRKLSFKDKIARRATYEFFPTHFHASTGTTGDPTPAVYTRKELFEVIPELAQQVFMAPDVLAPDSPHLTFDSRIMNGFPGVPHLAFFQAVITKFFGGVSCFDTGGGKVMTTERQIDLFARQGFNFIAIIPSYFVYWLRTAVELRESGKVGEFSNWKRAALGGEPASRELKDHFKEQAKKLGAHPQFEVIESLGMTEMKWSFLECKEGSGIHLNPKFFFWELLDKDTKKPVKEGEEGVLTFTHIGFRGTTFVRYWTGDLIRGGWTMDTCPHCGGTYPRIFSPICRAEKDFTKLKGTRVPLLDLIAAVRDTDGVHSFQIILETKEEDHTAGFGRDVLVLRLAAKEGVDKNDLWHRISHNMHATTEVTPDEVRWEDDPRKIENDLFAKTGIKAEYIIERRKIHI
ncbi:MAG: AMP-binding protein [Planctomycetes bacterium]|nr:AMP-binding protein [Planctomycetota bacterium]